MDQWCCRTKSSSAADSGPVLVDEADPAVELRVPGETFFEAGHADQDHAEAAAQADVAIAADRVGELGEPSVFFGDDEAGVGRQLRAGQFEIRERCFHERGELVPGYPCGAYSSW